MAGSFKKGSGSLDFGADDEEEAEQSTDAEAKSSTTDEPPAAEPEPERETSVEPSESPTYPYFVRRSSVTDERGNRLEIHVRDSVAGDERQYLNALADELGADNVAKTDAREFALKLAFEHPEQVAELMQDEGYGELD